MANLKQIETEITALENRRADLDEQLVNRGVVDGNVCAAMTLVDRQIQDLNKRKVPVSAGLPSSGGSSWGRTVATAPPTSTASSCAISACRPRR